MILSEHDSNLMQTAIMDIARLCARHAKENNENLGYKAYMEDELAIFDDAWILFKSKVKNLDEEKTIYSAYREVADEFKIKYKR